MQTDTSYDEVPKHHKRGGQRKRFGIEQWSDWFNRWDFFTRWYLTEAARDKALEALHKTCRNSGFSRIRATRYRKVSKHE